MKRPPGLWLLLSAGVLWLNMQDVYGIRATSLIFGRSHSTTTTTTTTEATVSEESVVESNKTDTSSNSTSTSANSTTDPTKPALTGIPQIDYIYDPNLPRELNGYNLSEYPFYASVPDDIEFKCDGLHDGFYASVPHKCQVYHHCLFGTRYDFLCANYTAFDQKTFICHFVSEVDCNNSHKFWHRNDALYKAATTTTPKPVFIPPATTAPPPAPVRPINTGGGGGGRRKPFRRPPPRYEYDDDYEDYELDYYEPPPPRHRGRRKRPRPRPRPVYDDDYEEYEEERYERRGGSGRRGGSRRPPQDRTDYDGELYDNRRSNDDRRRKEEKENKYARDNEKDQDDRKPYKNEERRHDKRRPSDERNYENSKKTERLPEEEYYDDEVNDRRTNDRPKKNKYEDEEEDDEQSRDRPAGDKPYVKPISGSSIYDQPRKAPRIRPPVPKNEQNKFSYKTTNSKPTTPSPPPRKQTQDAEYYDDEYEEIPPPRNKPHSKQGSSDNDSFKRANKPLEREEARDRDSARPSGYGSRPRGGSSRKPLDDDTDDEYEDVRPKQRRPYRYRPRYGVNRKRPLKEKDLLEDDDDMETAKSQNKQSTAQKDNRPLADEDKRSKEETEKPTTERAATESTTQKSNDTRKHQSYVRVVKRPFLPSRGGNPYSSRGLKPVGAKSLEQSRTTELEDTEKAHDKETVKEETMTENIQNEDDFPTPEEPSDAEENSKALSNSNNESENQNSFRTSGESTDQTKRKPFKPSVQITTGNGYNKGEAEDQSITSIQSRPSQLPPISRPNFSYSDPPRTTSKPHFEDKNPLDIADDEYDVTLNEAINPTIPNLPVRSYPTGFSSSRDNSYVNIQRPRVYQNFKPSYQLRPTSHGTIIIPHDDESPYISAENGFNPNVASEPQIYRSQNFRASPQVTQVRTQPYYSY